YRGTYFRNNVADIALEDFKNPHRTTPFKLRFLVLRRDGFSCQYCGRTPQDGAKLAVDHILSWTVAGDVVFDPMCGSGTTCKMAAINKRHYIGCDISKEYVELTKKRLKHFNL
ncbi:hypothetical protein KKH14_00030, partial [Patescibacteria group bacterium]|nr:hypothetical protein [Patescibacteria group bacterium]